MSKSIRGHTFKAFKPQCDGDEMCRCKWRCQSRGCLQFISHQQIELARRFVKETTNPKKRARSMQEYAKANLLRNGRQICAECMTVVFGVSRNKLYPQARKAKHAVELLKQTYSEKDISVMSWFAAQTFCLDCDPEDGFLTIPAAKKATVYKWYCDDAEKWPCCYQKCAKSYFNFVWREYYKNIKCRKWLRFAKCAICVRLRDIIANRENTREDRKRAQMELKEHYEAMKMEGAYQKKYVGFFFFFPPRSVSHAFFALEKPTKPCSSRRRTCTSIGTGPRSLRSGTPTSRSQRTTKTRQSRGSPII